MSHFAEIDSDGNVLRVIVAESAEWCSKWLGGNWIQTSYSGSIRKKYAGIGYKYRADLDAFIPPQPIFNYDLDPNTADWVFPDGDHIYVPIAAESAGYLSRAIYSLINPSEEGMYCGVIPHPTRPEVCTLQLRSSDIVPVHVAADPGLLRAVLEPFVENQQLTQEELDGIVSAIGQLGGQDVQIVDLIPPSWQPYVMTESQARDLGWIV
jgi:hypothetical protein